MVEHPIRENGSGQALVEKLNFQFFSATPLKTMMKKRKVHPRTPDAQRGRIKHKTCKKEQYPFQSGRMRPKLKTRGCLEIDKDPPTEAKEGNSASISRKGRDRAQENANSPSRRETEAKQITPPRITQRREAKTS